MQATSFERAFPRAIFYRYLEATGRTNKQYTGTAANVFAAVIKHTRDINEALHDALLYID